MKKTAPSFVWLVSGAASLVLFSALPASAQPREYVGPGKCVDCHDHQDEKAWSETKDGDGKGKRHLKALDQLEDPKAAAFKKAVGLVDAYDVKGTCVRCHATVVRGSADFGVSCESCHGAGKDYLKPHQDKGAYQAAVALGMRDSVKKPEAWVRDCQACHLLGSNAGDAALINAGHPAGDQFDLSTKFASVAIHFTSKYTAGQIATLARAGNRNTAAAPPAALAPVVTPPVAAPAPAAPPSPSTSPSAAPARVAEPAAAVPPPVARPAPDAATGGTPPLPPTLVVPAPQPQAAPAEAGATTASIPTPVAVAPQTRASVAGAIQGRLIGLLQSLLSQGVSMPAKLVTPAPTMSYRGADAELLQLQREAIALALEALSTKPPAKAPAPPQ